MDVRATLRRDGYAHLEGVLSTGACDEFAATRRVQQKRLPNMAHGDAVWDIRCLPGVGGVFGSRWGGEDLIVGFDGVGLREGGEECDGLPWHVDQDSSHEDVACCYQSLIAIKESSAATGTICVLPASHRHRRSLASRLDDEPGGWEFLEIPDDDVLFRQCLPPHCPLLRKGDMLLWDSRTAHMVCPPLDMATERMVVYVCMTPRRFADEETLRLRRHAYANGIATTHWPHWFVDRGEEWGDAQCIGNVERVRLV